MNITNKHNLPDPVVWAVKYYEAEYSGSFGHHKSDISVTQLLSPPQIVELSRQHADEMTEDVLDRIWALLGHSVHHILETAEEWGGKYKSGYESALFEERYFAALDGWIVSGKIDRYADGVLSDWKLCSVWEHILGMRPEREQQLNVLAWLMRQQSTPIVPERLEIHSFYRDWSKGQAKRGGDYPPLQFETHRIRLWSDDEAERFIANRIDMHKRARAGVEVPCTAEDQWAKETKYAVMKPGAKRAVKLHSDPAEAANHAQNIGGTVDLRPGERTRCDSYCPVKDYCPQYARESSDES